MQRIKKNIFVFGKYFVSAVTFLNFAVGSAMAAGFDLNITEENFISRFFWISFGIGIGSGVILIGIAGLTIAGAAGNPEKIQQGRDQFVSALIGLGVVVFAVVILRILGVEILGLPEGFWNNK